MVKKKIGLELSRRDFLKTAGAVSLLTALGSSIPMSILSTSCSKSSNSTQAIKNPTTYVEQVIGDPVTLDPAAAYDNASGAVLELVYDTLVRYHQSSTTQFDPGLSDTWTVSSDGLTYRFHIRQGVQFSNGDTLTPDDVAYSIERGMVQDYSAGPQWLFFYPFYGVYSSRDASGNLMPLSQLQSAISVDGEYVQFVLDAPFQPFLQILCGSWASIMDKAWCIQQGDWDGTEASYQKLNNPASDAWPLHLKMMGTGPFTFNYWSQGTEITFNRNDNYWRGKAYFQSVDIMTVSEWTDRKLALEAGDADYVDVPVENYSELVGVSGLTVYQKLPQVQVDAMFFTYDISSQSTFIGSGKLDGQGIPTNFFTDINVRKAFCYSFDWTTYINQVWQGYATQPDSPIVQGLAYYNANIPKYSYNAQQATTLFKAAWNGQLWTNGFTMTLAYNSGNTERQTACDILATNINALNPKFHVVSAAQQWTSYSSQWLNQLLPVFVVGWLPDYFDASDFIQPFMTSGGDFSGPQGYGNTATDALVNQAATATDTTTRQNLYNQLSTQYYNDAPGILLDQPSANRYFRSWIKGYFFNPAEYNDGGNPYYLSKG